jgi:hypothetical protein
VTESRSLSWASRPGCGALAPNSLLKIDYVTPMSKTAADMVAKGCRSGHGFHERVELLPDPPSFRLQNLVIIACSSGNSWRDTIKGLVRFLKGALFHLKIGLEQALKLRDFRTVVF